MVEPIRIGVSLPQTGRDARGAWAEHYNTYRLWVDEVNSSGGMLGRPVELVVYDDGSRPARSVENYERLIAEEVDLLFAPARTRTIEQVAPVTEEAQRLLLVGHGSGHGMFQQGRKYLFLCWSGTDFDKPRSFFEWATTLPQGQRPRRVALLHPDDPRPTHLDDPFHGINQHNVWIVLGTRHYADEFGVEVVHDEPYPDEPSGGHEALYATLFARIKAARPDAVVISNYQLRGGQPQTESLIRAYREAGLEDALLWLFRIPAAHGQDGGDRTADPLAPTRIDPLYEGAFTFDEWDPRSPYPPSRAFTDAFLEAYDYAPGNIAAGVYTACQVLQQAVEGARTFEGPDLREYLLDNSFETVMGTYRYQDNGVPRARMWLFQIIDGERRIVYPEEARTAEASMSVRL